MEEIKGVIIEFVNRYLNLYYLIAFMAVTYSLKNTIHAGLQWLFRHRLNKHFAVFVIGFVIALPFWLYFKHDKLILLVTYTVGTSIHDLIIAYLIKKAKRLLPKDGGPFPKDNKGISDE